MKAFVKYLSIGLPRKEIFNGKEVTTGICKKTVSGPIFLSQTGLEGDGVANTKHHGGADKALCIYSFDHYPYWRKWLGMELVPSAFGENLTVQDMIEENVCIGDIFSLGSAVIQVSQPRQPCATLGLRYGAMDLVKEVINTGFTGFYCRVIQTGYVEQGESLDLQKRDELGVSIAFANRILHHHKIDLQGIEKVLSVSALSESWKKSFEELHKKSVGQFL